MLLRAVRFPQQCGEAPLEPSGHIEQLLLPRLRQLVVHADVESQAPVADVVQVKTTQFTWEGPGVGDV